MKSCWAEDQYRRPSFKSLTTSLEEMLEKGIDYLQLNFKQIVNNMCYMIDGKNIIYISFEIITAYVFCIMKIIFLDEVHSDQNHTLTISTEEEVKYETPKPLNEIGMSYLTMKDFKFDPEQQAQVV